MPRFFVSSSDITDGVAHVYGDDRDHIVKTLRMRVGEAIELCDGEGNVYHGTVSQFNNLEVLVDCFECVPCDSEPDTFVTVCFAVPKGDKAELMVQKCVELGAKRIVLYMSSRCISRPDDKSSAKKIARLSRIAAEAAKQSERGVIPTVEGIYSFEAMLQIAKEHEKSLFFYERGGLPIKELLKCEKPKSVAIITGAEGGFSDDEVSQATEAGLSIASLGKRILRCETAPLCAISAVMYHTDNL